MVISSPLGCKDMARPWLFHGFYPSKIDFVSDDNTGDFKTIIWRDTELAVLEEGSEKIENGSPKCSPKTGESSEKNEKNTQKMVNNEDLKLVEIAENLVENPETLVENQETFVEKIEKLVEGMLEGKSRQRVLIR